MTVLDVLMLRLPSPPLVFLSDDISRVADRIAQTGIGAVVVLDDGGTLAGLISAEQLVSVLSQDQDAFRLLKARDVMDLDIFTCTTDQPALEVMMQMSDRSIRHAVAMLHGHVFGIVTLDEIVKARLQNVAHVTGRLAAEPGYQSLLAVANEHPIANLDIFAVYRAWIAAEREIGIEELDDRAKQILWFLADAEHAGRSVQLKDLMKMHRWGSYPTVRRSIDQLLSAGLVEYGPLEDGRGKPFTLSDRGRDLFQRVSSAVSEHMAA